MGANPQNVRYLKRLYPTVAVAFLLAYFPLDGWFVRFLCIMVFGILAAWTDRAIPNR